jgi:hypothetical protein
MEKYRKEFDKMNDETNINFGPSIKTKEDKMASLVILSEVIIGDEVVPNKFNFTINGREKSISGTAIRKGKNSTFLIMDVAALGEIKSQEERDKITDYIWESVQVKFDRMESERVETTTQGA